MAGNVNCAYLNANWREFKAARPVKPAIHIWQANTADLLAFENNFYASLSPDEAAAAARFYRQADRQRYVTQHGLLRLLLKWRLQSSLEAVYTYNVNKKPYLANSEYTGQCFFNLSHSSGNLLIAIGNCEMGVDIEQVNVSFNFSDIISNYFSIPEIAFINNAADAHRAFFLLWTRKEALLKAGGWGIDDDLPAIPALDGTHRLPAHFGNNDFVSRSFTCANNGIASLTSARLTSEIEFWTVAPESINGLL